MKRAIEKTVEFYDMFRVYFDKFSKTSKDSGDYNEISNLVNLYYGKFFGALEMLQDIGADSYLPDYILSTYESYREGRTI